MEAERDQRAFRVVMITLAIVLLASIGFGGVVYFVHVETRPPPATSHVIDEAADRAEAYQRHRMGLPSRPLDAYFDFGDARAYRRVPVGERSHRAVVAIEPEDARRWGADCTPISEEERRRFDQIGALDLLPAPDTLGELRSTPRALSCGDHDYLVVYEEEGVVLVFEGASEDASAILDEGASPVQPLP